jgi:hypothetical protein
MDKKPMRSRRERKPELNRKEITLVAKIGGAIAALSAAGLIANIHSVDNAKQNLSQFNEIKTQITHLQDETIIGLEKENILHSELPGLVETGKAKLPADRTVKEKLALKNNEEKEYIKKESNKIVQQEKAAIQSQKEIDDKQTRDNVLAGTGSLAILSSFASQFPIVGKKKK